MPTIDERVVSMTFDNAKFEAGVAQTMATLAKLDFVLKNVGAESGLSKLEAESRKISFTGPMTALDKLKQKLGMTSAGTTFTDMEKASQKVALEAPMTALDKLKQKLGATNAGTTFSDMEKAAQGVNFGNLTQAIDGIGGHFSALQVAAVAALGTIVSKATLVGGQLAKSLSLGPITQGFEEYSTNLNSIQTILANTQASGAGLQEVNAALQELNEYSDKTIYNFSQMAQNIGTFTAAGVDLDRATASIKGIANLAALSGTNSEKASQAMYQLSQAISSGRVSLQDWNSVVNAGMGGTVFQRALATTAEQMGTLSKGAVKLKGKMKNVSIEGQSFRESITAKPGETSWLTSDVLTRTLTQFTGDLTDADLAAQGFNKSQIKAIQAQAETAKKAATEVKTLKGVFDVAKESMGSGWATTFQNIFGDFEEAKSTFTGVSTFFQEVIGESSDARNKILSDWKALGGRDDLFAGLKAGFDAFIRVFNSVKNAFREFFPRKTGEDLADLSARFKEFMEGLIPSVSTMQKLHSIFEGFFAVLHIGWTILKQVGRVIADLFGVVGEGSGGFLEAGAAIGEWLTQVDKALTQGGLLVGIFESIGAVLRVPLEIIKEVASALANMFFGTDAKKAEGVSNAMSRLNEALLPLRGVMDDVRVGWDKFLGILSRIREEVEPGFTRVLDFLGKFGTMVADKFEAINWDRALNAFEAGLIGAILLKVKDMFSGINIDLGGGLFKNLNDGLGVLTNHLTAMQRNIQAKTLLAIAAAIGLLAAGVFVLSQIPADDLSRAMSAVAIGLAQLLGAMILMGKVGTAGFLQMGAISASMILLATAVTILAVAMRIMARLSWDEIGRGLAGIAGVLLAVAGASHLLNGPKLMAAAIALIPLGIGLNLIAVATKVFASMDPKELGVGLLGLAVSLDAIAAAMWAMPPNMLLSALGIVAVAFGLNLIAAAVAAFGGMDLKAMVQGILGVAGSLILIGGAIMAIPPTIALQAAGLVILAGALIGVAAAVKLFGSMDLGTLAKGMLAMFLTLDVLAMGLMAMTGTMPGSLALLAAAAALVILGPALAFMGQLKWTTILKGLATMALTLTVLAIAGALAAGPITAIGIALAILGGAMLVISAALSLLVLSLAELGKSSPRAIGAMVAAFGAFLLILPKMIIDFVMGIVTILAEIAKLAPKIAESLVSIVGTLLTGLAALVPKMRTAIGALIVGILGVLTDNAPKIIEAGFQLLVSLMTGVRDNMGQVIILAADIIVNLLTGLGTQAPRIVAAGVDMLDKLVEGLLSQLPKLIDTVVKLITGFIGGIVGKIPEIATAGLKLMLKFIATIVGFGPKLVTAGVGAILSFIGGIGDAIPKLITQGVNAAGKFLNGLGKGLVRLANLGFEAIIDFLHGIEASIRKNSDRLFSAGAGVADAIMDGLIEQFNKAGPLVRKALEAVFSLLPGWAKDILGIASPSKVFAEIGKFTMLGFIEGMQSSKSDVKAAMEDTADNVVDAATTSFAKIPDALDGIMDLNPVITPVLDLTNVKKDAAQLEDMANVVPISVAASFDSAAAISTDQQTAAEAAQADQARVSFEYNQYNTSPEKLTEIEIYRQTKNQLATVKTGLGLAT